MRKTKDVIHHLLFVYDTTKWSENIIDELGTSETLHD